jgi:hypothetical protein
MTRASCGRRHGTAGVIAPPALARAARYDDPRDAARFKPMCHRSPTVLPPDVCHRCAIRGCDDDET